jgi:DNA (cytosine-5)-methyltransferase 1
LPKFPEPTHGDVGSGLKPFVKIRDAITNIPRHATLQSLMSQSRNPRLLTPYSADTFAKTITCGGGQKNYHPSGGRHYNARELASLQGFPPHHHFAPTIQLAKRQIGNAVPPPLGKLMFESVIKSLQETDDAIPP